jgi:hypothetical protein
LATYTVAGHPLNVADLVDNAADLDVIRGQLATHGVGTTITVTVSAGSAVKATGHKVLQ